MNSLIHWLAVDGNVLAVVVTVGFALLLVCCLECSECRKRDDDDLFRHHSM
jgi:hypothetical protein